MASSKREKELARQRAERQAARRAAAAAKRKQRNVVLAGVAAALFAVLAIVGVGLAVLGGDDDERDTVTAGEAPSAGPSAAPETGAPSSDGSPSAAGDTCEFTKTPDPAARPVTDLPPSTGFATDEVFTVTATTSRGDVVFEVDSGAAPCTVQSLRTLAAASYFDDTPCHRLTTAGISVLQCGDPTGTGGGGPGYQFAEENLEGATYPKGTVAMANAGPGTNGSQFFLVYADSLSLPPDYTPFGTIVKGLDILEQVAAAGSDDSNGAGDGKPKLPVQITTLRVAPKA